MSPRQHAATSLRSRPTIRRLRLVAGVCTTLAVAAGCSGSVDFSIGGQSVDEAAVELIEGELADSIGLGELTADCPEVPDPEVGSEFSCTATTADGEVIELAGVVDREDHIDVSTSNVIVADALPQLEAAGVDVVNADQGLALDPSVLDCGDSSIVIAPDGTATCVLTDPDTGDLYDVVYTIDDLTTGDFTLELVPR